MKTKIFSLMFISLLLSAWLPYQGALPIGEAQHSAPTKPSKSRVLNGDFQREFELYWNQKFGLRNILVRAKNSIYSLINLNNFHYSFFRQIVTGKDGYLFQKNFIVPNFCTDKCELMVQKNLDTIEELAKNLDQYGIPLLVVLLPDKASQLREYWPELWIMQDKYNKNKKDWHKYYERELLDRNVPTLNLQEVYLREVQQDINFKKWGFLKTGEHWSLVGAGYAVKYLGDFLAHHSSLRFDQSLSRSMKFSQWSLHSETDLWDLLNRLKFQQTIKNPQYPYWDYDSVMARDENRIILYGDSYTNQLYKALVASGFLQYDDVQHFENRAIDENTLMTILQPKSPFIVAYTLPNLASSRVSNDLKLINASLRKNFVLDQNWISNGNNQYLLPERASLKFLSNGSEKQFSFVIQGKMKTVSEFRVLVNGNKVYDYKFDGELKEFKQIKLNLPTKVGVNEIDIITVGVVQPLFLSMPDWRVIGLNIGELSIN